MNQKQKLERAIEALNWIASHNPGQAAMTAEEAQDCATRALEEIAAPGRGWKPPTQEEVSEYMKERERQGSRLDFTAEQWINHYEAVGWNVGRNRMKDWKAAVRTWEKAMERTPQTPDRRSIGGRLVPEDCLSAANFEDWWGRQTQFAKTEQMRFYVHSVRAACRGDFYKICKALDITAKTGKLLDVPAKAEEVAAEELKKLR